MNKRHTSIRDANVYRRNQTIKVNSAEPAFYGLRAQATLQINLFCWCRRISGILVRNINTNLDNLRQMIYDILIGEQRTDSKQFLKKGKKGRFNVMPKDMFYMSSNRVV